MPKERKEEKTEKVTVTVEIERGWVYAVYQDIHSSEGGINILQI